MQSAARTNAILNAAQDMEEILESMKADVGLARLRVDTMLAVGWYQDTALIPSHPELTAAKRDQLNRQSQTHAVCYEELDAQIRRLSTVRRYVERRSMVAARRVAHEFTDSDKAHLTRVKAALREANIVQRGDISQSDLGEPADEEECPSCPIGDAARSARSKVAESGSSRTAPPQQEQPQQQKEQPPQQQ